MFKKFVLVCALVFGMGAVADAGCGVSFVSRNVGSCNVVAFKQFVVNRAFIKNRAFVNGVFVGQRFVRDQFGRLFVVDAFGIRRVR